MMVVMVVLVRQKHVQIVVKILIYSIRSQMVVVMKTQTVMGRQGLRTILRRQKQVRYRVRQVDIV